MIGRAANGGRSATPPSATSEPSSAVSIAAWRSSPVASTSSARIPA
jgi:hypothetical protein